MKSTYFIQTKPGCIDAQLYEQVTDDPNSFTYLETEIWEDEKAMLDSFIDDLYDSLHHDLSDFYTLKSNWYYINGTSSLHTYNWLPQLFLR